ncbi:MAG: competence/damage-inducible protein A [Solirubrobacteraceae bacterium]
MSARAAIVVTGTEVLTGRVRDRNGPWLSDRLRELGVDLAQIAIVGDRPEDMLAALESARTLGVDVVITSGGLGPTADDLTAAVVGEFCEREMVLDEALEQRIAAIIGPLLSRWPGLDADAIAESNRKQAVVPDGACVLEPVGTAPGLVVAPQRAGKGPVVVVLPGPPRELQPMWRDAAGQEAFLAAIAGAGSYEQRMLRLFGIPESEIAATLRFAAESGVALESMEITTCLRRGEVEIVTRYEPSASAQYAAFVQVVRARHADTLFSDDGSSVDQQVARALRSTGTTVAVAESCTGGLLSARLTELAGSSEYFAGGVVAYSNAIKVAAAGVPSEVLDRFGAVSVETARSLAAGVRQGLTASFGIGVTGVAGPGGGTEERPVGRVCFSICGPDGGALTRQLDLPGARADVRDRSTTVALHLLRRYVVLGERDSPA